MTFSFIQTTTLPQLFIDEMFLSISNECKESDEVIFFEDGSWKPNIIEKKSKKSKVVAPSPASSSPAPTSSADATGPFYKISVLNHLVKLNSLFQLSIEKLKGSITQNKLWFKSFLKL